MGRSHYNKKKKNILAPSLNVFVFSCGLLPVASSVTGNVILNFSCIFMVFCDCSSKSQLSCGKSFVICFSSGSFLYVCWNKNTNFASYEKNLSWLLLDCSYGLSLNNINTIHIYIYLLDVDNVNQIQSLFSKWGDFDKAGLTDYIIYKGHFIRFFFRYLWITDTDLAISCWIFLFWFFYVTPP